MQLYRCKQGATSRSNQLNHQPCSHSGMLMATTFATSTFPLLDHRDILRNPENSIFNLDMILGRLKEIGGSDIVALHQLAQNHCYFVINVPYSLVSQDSHRYENLSSRFLTCLQRMAGTMLGSQEIVFLHPVPA